MPRIAIDTNTPEIGIEIQGILQDDDVNFESESNATLVQGNSIMLNFASILPTSTEVLNETVFDTGEYYGGQTIYTHILTPVVIRSSVNSHIGVTGTSTTIDIHNIDSDDYSGGSGGLISSLEATDNDANADTGVDIAHPSSGTYAAGTTSIVVDSSSHSIEVGQRLHKDDGTFIGTVTGVSGATLAIAGGTKVSLSHNADVYSYQATLFNRRHQVIGSITEFVDTKSYDDDGNMESRLITHITVDRVEVPVSDKEAYLISRSHRPPNETFLHNKQIRLYPNFWRVSDTNVGNGGQIPASVVIQFDAGNEAHHTYTTESSGGTAISITQQGRFGYVPNIDVKVTVPVKGITTEPSNGNPAATLALMVKDALELSGQAVTATHDHITSTGGIALQDAFSATVSGPLIEINQLDSPKKTEWGNNLAPCLQMNEENAINDPATLLDATLVCEHFGVDAVESMAITNKSRSAGDKVQDLLGLFSNAQKQRDLIRGIQIPYDSLIQSSGVTGVARNFFLTFGEQSINDKGSLANTISASEKMTPSLLPYEVGGSPVDEKDDNWAERFGLGQLTDVEGTLGNFLENLVADSLITLSSSAHGNDGGMRILPEKLHVRYDAGNNYYAFNMKLLASDFVMGV
tara:strand:+ start:1 stop:1899 length:1899 start_codon:yes stop_codon:yes gene_type:complete